MEDVELEKSALTGRYFSVNLETCNAAPGCHASAAAAQVLLSDLQADVSTGLAGIETRLENLDVNTNGEWEYSCCGGPSDQSGISEEVKKVRFLLKYIEGDASVGAHNPAYVDLMLQEADRLLNSNGL